MPTLNPPYTDTGTWGDGIWRGTYSDLWNYGFTYPEGQAIVKIAGQWITSPAVSLDFAEEFYLGGYTHEITDAKAAELTAAGFGAYITFEDGAGYGQGQFGQGLFGH